MEVSAYVNCSVISILQNLFISVQQNDRIWVNYPFKLIFLLIVDGVFSDWPVDLWEVPFEEISELQWLGSGAQGAVFLGKFRSEEVAIKKVREQKETDIKHLRKLKHPNVISFK